MPLSYEEQILRQFRRAVKEKNEPKALYYSQQFDNSACASWENFKGSWAGQEWMKKHFPA